MINQIEIGGVQWTKLSEEQTSRRREVLPVTLTNYSHLHQKHANGAISNTFCRRPKHHEPDDITPEPNLGVSLNNPDEATRKHSIESYVYS